MLTKKQIIELQKEHGTDAEIGRAVGLTRERIRQYREIYSIPKGRRAVVKDAVIKVLSPKLTSKQIAEIVGCSRSIVTETAREKGVRLKIIKRKYTKRYTRKELIDLLKRYGNDRQIAIHCGISAAHVGNLRNIYGIPRCYTAFRYGNRCEFPRTKFPELMISKGNLLRLLKKNKFNIRKTREELGCSYQHVRNMLFRYGISLTGLTHDKDCNGS